MVVFADVLGVVDQPVVVVVFDDRDVVVQAREDVREEQHDQEKGKQLDRPRIQIQVQKPELLQDPELEDLVADFDDPGVTGGPT